MRKTTSNRFVIITLGIISMLSMGTINTLEKFDIHYQVSVLSAHRCTEEVLKYIKEIETKGFEVIIAAAGKAAHLPGVIAANTSIPVIGVPIETSDLGGLDSLLSIVQMPKDVPVATIAIGTTGAVNAAILALKILGTNTQITVKKLMNTANG